MLGAELYAAAKEGQTAVSQLHDPAEGKARPVSRPLRLCRSRRPRHLVFAPKVLREFQARNECSIGRFE